MGRIAPVPRHGRRPRGGRSVPLPWVRPTPLTSIIHPYTLNTLNQSHTLDTLNRPYTLTPFRPYTLHPTPCTLHPKPSTLNLKP